MPEFIRRASFQEIGDRLVRTNPIIECECGDPLELSDAMTNRCAGCGAFYNGPGQRLAHPSQWGEETGERFDDLGTQII